jgi:hypothetical protein
MSQRHAYEFGLRVGRARARHGSPLPVLLLGWPPAFWIGCQVGRREIEMGRRA